jgi:SAM-dependent methyltransferase
MKLFVPLLDNGNGSVMSSFMRDFFDAFRKRDMVFALASDSHANRGMNKIANAFLVTDCDVWFNVDADIRFRRQDVDMMIEHVEAGVPLVYGIYPKKEEKTEPCLCTFPNMDQPDPKTGLVELRRCGRGFMLMKREVLEAMKEDNGGPALRYHNHETIQWDFFPSGAVTGSLSALELPAEHVPEGLQQNLVDPDGFPIREWISEDWYFCERARALGYPTMVDARIALGHIGIKEYRFNQSQVTRTDSFIESWQGIHGWFDYSDLYKELAVKLPDGGTFVEVGCWMGKSIAFMADALKKIKKHVAIHVVDTFKGSPENQVHADLLDVHGGTVEHVFRANMQALGIALVDHGAEVESMPSLNSQLIMVHNDLSTAAADHFEDESLDCIFIDGDHSEKAVRADINAYFHKVKPGGILCGHDIDEPGVAAAVAGSFSDFRVQGRCWIYQRDLSMAKSH